MKVVYWFWYGRQRGCDPFGVDDGHGDDWEHVTVNLIREETATTG